MSTLVSVIIPAYNQGHYLATAIDSVLAQTYQDVEVIVVDDGSTDDTAAVTRGYDDSRVRYIYKENGGLSSARNEGLRQARGAYISYLDSDDCFLPNKLESLVALFETESALGLVAGQAIPVNEAGETLGKRFDTPLPDDLRQLVLGNPLHVGSVLVRRQHQDRVGFFDERLRSYEDWDMWLRLARTGCRMTTADVPVSLYRFHRDQMTRDGGQMTTATFAVLDKLFGDPTLPPDWSALKEAAYSQAYLRKTAQAYRVRDYALAQESLSRAIELNPALVRDDAHVLAARMAAWVELPKTSDKFAFLEDIYNNLPDDLTVLRARRRQDLGRAAMQMAYESYAEGDMVQTRTAVRRAVRYQPGWLVNKGTISIFMRSHIQRLPKNSSL